MLFRVLAISFNSPTSAFARIENHYFVHEVRECYGATGRASFFEGIYEGWSTP
jgi:hypothetical protein